MSTIVNRFFVVAVAAGGLMMATGAGENTTLQGVLIDKHCSYKAESRVVPGPRIEGGIVVAYAHSKQCNLMQECQRSGYGVFTYDQKFVPFDEAGSQKALAYLKQSKQDDDFRVEVTGQMQGEVFKVAGIKPLN